MHMCSVHAVMTARNPHHKGYVRPVSDVQWKTAKHCTFESAEIQKGTPWKCLQIMYNLGGVW